MVTQWAERVMLLALGNNFALITELKDIYRQEEKATIEMQKSFRKRAMHVFLSLISADETIGSNSEYLGLVEGLED